MKNRTLLSESGIIIDQLPHDGASGNTARPSPEGDKSVVGLSYSGGRMEDEKFGDFILQCVGKRERRGLTEGQALVSYIVWMTILVLFVLSFFIPDAKAQEGMVASWYSEYALKRDGQWDLTKGVTASGQLFSDSKLTAASCKYFGKTVKITRTDTKASVVVLVNDKTAKRFAETRIDLSPVAFSRLAYLEQGIIPVTVEVLK